ncbi:hypothetical protein HDF26_004912 [Pedobacter cryoconitis]|uniref:Uncharacterized protein n=1 Tax=Pedobacter cryoconitis TaxID=188932 RepID=A0A7W9E2F0_9SPHI|nr:hypothetical protein [Pedobacter cryoconitis]MBB5638695.1 hypothetical protein [Pedobacter cryoconitis]MBB6274438.1 hypothetical protein [Pedobacter cryoconitis]
MYKRDLITAEIQKLSQAIARILGLKQEGKLEEADNGLNEMLEADFGILFSDLVSCDPTDFMAFLTEKNFPAEKLEILSQVLYIKFGIIEQPAERKSVAEKLQLTYETLEVKHHVVNMNNLSRQKTVKDYLNQNG